MRTPHFETYLVGFFGAILLGLIAASSYGTVAFAASSAMLIVSWGLLRSVPATLGFLVVLAQNGLPLIDVGARVNQTGDFVVLVVIALAVFHLLTSVMPEAQARRLKYSVLLVSPLLVWWVVILLYSVINGIPWSMAGLYGRDFLYLGLLLPAFIILLRNKQDGMMALATMGSLVALYVCGRLLFQLGTGGFLVHPLDTVDTAGIARVYSYMNEPLTWFVCVSVFASVTFQGWRRTILSIALMASLVVVALNFTRAMYLGLPVALFITILLAANLGTRQRRIALRIGISVAALLIVAVFVVPVLSGDREGGAATAVMERVLSVDDEATSASGNLAYRSDLIKITSERLQGHWVVGLGFLHPKVDYQPDFPDGSIRNSDIGLFAALVTMGLVGTALLFLVPIGVLWRIVKQMRFADPHAGPARYIVGFGGIFWLVTVLVTSVTLGVLFSIPGVIFAAFTMAGTLTAIDR